jgi:hypothetical protein
MTSRMPAELDVTGVTGKGRVARRGRPGATG